MKRSTQGLAAAALALTLSAPAVAVEAGDWIIRIGGSNVAPKDDNGEILGVGINVDDQTTLSITGEYMFTDNWGVELLASTPFQHAVSVAGVQVSTIKHLPPTLSLNYHFNSDSDFKPYLGVGWNYTLFSGEENTGGFLVLDGALGGVGLGSNPELTLDDSSGLALQAGLDLMLNDQTSVNVGVRWIDIDAEIELGGVGTGVDAEIDPLVYTLAIGYRF